MNKSRISMSKGNFVLTNESYQYKSLLYGDSYKVPKYKVWKRVSVLGFFTFWRKLKTFDYLPDAVKHYENKISKL